MGMGSVFYGWVGLFIFVRRVASAVVAGCGGCQPLFALIALSIFAAFFNLFYFFASLLVVVAVVVFSTRTWQKYTYVSM